MFDGLPSNIGKIPTYNQQGNSRLGYGSPINRNYLDPLAIPTFDSSLKTKAPEAGYAKVCLALLDRSLISVPQEANLSSNELLKTITQELFDITPGTYENVRIHWDPIQDGAQLSIFVDTLLWVRTIKERAEYLQKKCPGLIQYALKAIERAGEVTVPIYTPSICYDIATAYLWSGCNTQNEWLEYVKEFDDEIPEESDSENYLSPKSAIECYPEWFQQYVTHTISNLPESEFHSSIKRETATVRSLLKLIDALNDSVKALKSFSLSYRQDFMPFMPAYLLMWDENDRQMQIFEEFAQYVSEDYREESADLCLTISFDTQEISTLDEKWNFLKTFAMVLRNMFKVIEQISIDD